jgi:hypothetical protein
MSSATRDQVHLLLAIIDEAYEKQAWHGPNLRGSIRGITEREASWRPNAHRHNIWEIVLHAAYWKYAVRRRLLSDKRGSFPRKGSNWFVRPEIKGGSSWKEDLALLENEHRAMRVAIAGLHDNDINKKRASSKVTIGRIVAGIAAHDIYHAGQIQLLKRLQKGMA